MNIKFTVNVEHHQLTWSEPNKWWVPIKMVMIGVVTQEEWHQPLVWFIPSQLTNVL